MQLKYGLKHITIVRSPETGLIFPEAKPREKDLVQGDQEFSISRKPIIPEFNCFLTLIQTPDCPMCMLGNFCEVTKFVEHSKVLKTNTLLVSYSDNG